MTELDRRGGDIALETNDAGKELLLRDADLNGEDLRCTLIVHSAGFSVERAGFWVLGIRSAVADLAAMYESVSGQAEFRDMDEVEHQFVRFVTDKQGHLSVSGVVRDVSPHNLLQFELNTDIGALGPFVSRLGRLCGSV